MSKHYIGRMSLLLGTLVVGIINGIDNPHFYRANFLWQEPRFATDWLTTWDFLLAGGETKKAFNKYGDKTPLLNIFGLHDMQFLGQNVPGLDPSNPLDEILIALEALPVRDDFGKLSFKGNFSTIEGIVNGYQNLKNGFFLEAYLPIRRLSITNINFIDESPDDTIFPNKNTPEWRAFLDNFPEILAMHNLFINNVHETSFGDFTVLGGWTLNCLDTCYLDYYDVTAKVGILFPTGKKRKLSNPFDLPTGYDGFYGLPLKFDCSFGYWEWFTMGAHIGALFLFERTQLLALKTAPEQNGFIFLAQGEVKVDPGTIWEVSTYVKADHFFRGLSILVGYCFTLKDADCIEATNYALFPPYIVKSDPRFKSWRMHVVHWFFEYDFAQSPNDVGPRVGCFYNWLIGGRRIFDTKIAGVSFGIDVEWCF